MIAAQAKAIEELTAANARLVERVAHLERIVSRTDDFDATYVFVNLDREPRFAPWRPESVYDLVERLRRQLAGQVPESWTPHWMRHSHATALLLSGVPVHVVSRRLGHSDVQTTLSTYAHVTEDAEMRAAADWTAFTAGWRTRVGGVEQTGLSS